ncbi:MAG TPA: nuclear transport factor 2 family protein [Clostridia bacterium]|nr:nuclear transport factor 2 family protein [Clostridia bacterium]
MKRMLVATMLLALATTLVAAQESEKAHKKGSMTGMDSSSQMKTDPQVEQALKAMEQKWAEASKNGRPEEVEPMLAEDVVMVDSDGTMVTKQDVLSRMKGAKWEENSIAEVEVKQFGNTAIATGTWRGKGTLSNGKKIDTRERWTDTWVKMPDGKWKVVASQAAPITGTQSATQ